VPGPELLEALVAAIPATWFPKPIGPIHAIFLAFPLPLFLAALVSDFAYWSTFQAQWANFSSWLIAAGLVGGGFALICGLGDLLSAKGAFSRKRIAYLIVLLVMWTLGFINAFVHAKDAHATMPEGLYLSALVTLLALVSCWIGYSGFHAGEPA
jgi:uncharacterized membrane protein